MLKDILICATLTSAIVSCLLFVILPWSMWVGVAVGVSALCGIGLCAACEEEENGETINEETTEGA